MEALIIAFILAYAIKKAAENGHLDWQGSKAANRRSSRGRPIPKRAASAVQHDTGYWAHQVLNGFPKARHGFADGWHAGRMAQADGRAARAKARAEHLEQRARLLPELREHRRRADEALAQIRAAREPEPEPDFPVLLTGRSGSGRPVNPFTGEPYDTVTVWDRADLDRRRAAAAQDPDMDITTRAVPLPRDAGGEASPATSTEEGTTMASDVTYDGVLRHVTMAQDFEEAALAERTGKAAEASAISDQMQALSVDPATLGAMADYLDAMEEAQKAQQRAMEAAQAVAANLQRGHAGLAEAHRDAPVRAAAREFYEE